MALRTMYDSVDMDAIPPTAEVVAGYPFRVPSTWNPGRFPHALVVAIDQSAEGSYADQCHAVDYEPGAVWGQGLLTRWVLSWHQLHPGGLAAQNGWFTRPLVYVDLDNLPGARAALTGLAWDLWVAEWPGPGQVLEPGAVAHQYAGSATSGGNYDLSVVSDTFGARPVVTPPPVPAPSESFRQTAALAAARMVVQFLEAPDPS